MAVKQIVYNKKANFEYEILEKYEAGIVLQGTEVKSIKAGKCSITEAYLIDKDEELFIKGMNISEYKVIFIIMSRYESENFFCIEKKFVKYCEELPKKGIQQCHWLYF